MARANIAVVLLLALALVAASSIDAARVVPAAETELIAGSMPGRSLTQDGRKAGWYNGKYEPGPPTAASKAPAVKTPLVCKYGPKSKLGQNKVCN
ncbi:g682 [Coccomyxa viridis]|uniref:G682 protein n=1 Tax=Coccomyxa viridis TaxID=1274662 RepID=A0ABP1FG96_9CHLO